MKLASPHVFARLVFTVFLSASPAYGQTDFTGLEATSGDIVFVTRATGARISGRLDAVSPFSIIVNQEPIPYEPGLRIAREGDRLLNGLVIGVGIGILAGTTIGAEACPERPLVYCAVGGAAVWGGLGTL